MQDGCLRISGAGVGRPGTGHSADKEVAFLVVKFRRDTFDDVVGFVEDDMLVINNSQWEVDIRKYRRKKKKEKRSNSKNFKESRALGRRCAFFHALL